MTGRTDFAVLGTQRVARDLGVTLPELYWAPRPVRNGLKTCRGVVIGGAIEPKPAEMGSNALHLSAALNEPRTAKPLPLLQRIAGAVWRWC